MQMRVRHREGPLEAVVESHRRRNLGIGFGVLLLLGISMVFLLVSSGRAQRLAEQQLAFAAGISHELRTPLAVLKSAGENLADGVIHDAEHAQQYGNVIKSEVVRLADMVEKTLDYAGIQSGKRKYEKLPLDLAEIVEAALEAAKKSSGAGDLTAEVSIEPDLPRVQGDPDALYSALENLFTNAIKYGGDRRWIGVEAKSAPSGAKRHVEIAVKDAGIGIPAADLPHIFTPFYRGRNALDGQLQGTGLGLSIAKHAIEAHGGTIAVKTSAGKGSTFIVHLPVAARPRGSP